MNSSGHYLSIIGRGVPNFEEIYESIKILEKCPKSIKVAALYINVKSSRSLFLWLASAYNINQWYRKLICLYTYLCSRIARDRERQ